MYYLGVDLGGMSIKAGLVNEKYEIIATKSVPTLRERPAAAVLKDMAILCKDVLNEANLTEKDIHSIGIGSPGIASPEEGVILSSSNLNFNHVDVRTEMQKYLNCDVYVENDANCAALGEAVAGAAKGEKNVVVVTLGTGVGGGIITEGKIYRGGFCGAGEVGHQVIVKDGIQCGCGRKGCFEQYASATALIREAQEAAKEHINSKMVSFAKGGQITNITAKNVFDAAQAGDPIAAEVLGQYFKYVAMGITNIINILEPNMIVLGGGMSAQKDYLVRPIKEFVQEEMYGGLSLKTKIRAAELGNAAGIIGAALLGTTLK
nr:ROK family protein [uncultured Cellulosilyticum sp.]